MQPSPAIVRIAGLPASVLEPFSSRLCVRIAELCALETDLERSGAALADRLHEEVPGAPPDVRRILLAARRDCFNGRSLLHRRARPEWAEIDARTGGLAGATVDLEERAAGLRARIEEDWNLQRAQERRSLLEALESPGLLRGVALASPVTVANLERLRRAAGGRDHRKETRLESTLARYLTRAAFKLSPYSTLTRVGLSRVLDDIPEGPVQLVGSDWGERSLFRIKRYLLDQLWELLRRYPPFRQKLRVELNDTIEEVEPRRYRFLRPGLWDHDEAAERFRYQPPSLVTASLEGPVVAWLLRELPRRRLTWEELCLAVESESGAPPDACRNTLERLLRIGFLCLLPPWPAQAEQLEERMLAHLLSLPADPALSPLTEILGRLVALQLGYAGAAEPARSAQEMDGLIDELWSAAAPLAGFSPQVQRSRLRTGNFYEDVLLLGPSPEKEVLRIPRASAARIQRSLAPLVRFTDLYNRRHDFLLTLGAFMADRWPGRGEVGVLELFGATRSLWQEYMKFIFGLRVSKDRTATFDPLGVPQLAQLRQLRGELWKEIEGCLEPGPGGLRLRTDALAKLASRIPDRWAPKVGPCLSLQPADREGRLWVLNRFREGTGRHGARYTPVMDGEMRRAFTGHFAARGWDDEGGEFLDVTCAQGDTLNVHALQTQRMLELPGEPLDLAAEHRVSLRDLRVLSRGAGSAPELVDLRGLPCRPVHLGGAGFDFVPAPLKLLSLFGPGEMRLLLPPRIDRRNGEVAVRERVTLDDIVLLRKRWSIEPSPFQDALEGSSEANAFVAINRWRLQRGIPDRVFFIERIHHEQRTDLYKPQYLDFTSPLLVLVFRSALRQNAGSLTFEEMLPAPADLATHDESGRPWAVEILLDTLALRAPGHDHPEAVDAPPEWPCEPLLAQQPIGRSAGLAGHGG
ncbi:MAG TPA: lantibiotic dehydratase [Thermoanaerobaculia bacterium]|nr:lantibiotic dehydratase [Thermoanaerobaculia bacterium]